MDENAAFPQSANHRLRLAPVALLLTATFVLVAFAGPASAKRHQLVGRDGKIHACYRVKGKPKGMMRIVRGRSHRCRRGERRVAWSAVATGGAVGAVGQSGSHGVGGSAGSDDAALKAQVGALSLRVEALESVLQGLTNEDLLGAVAAVPTVESLCEQASALTAQTNLLGTEVGDLVSILGSSLLGGIFGGVSVPPALDPFACVEA